MERDPPEVPKTPLAGLLIRDVRQTGADRACRHAWPGVSGKLRAALERATGKGNAVPYAATIPGRLALCASGSGQASEPHRHHDVARGEHTRCVNKTAAVGVSETDLDAISLNGTQGVEKVIHVEADLDFLAFVRDLHLILRFLLLRVVRLEREKIRPHRQPDAPVLLVREDGSALQCLPQGFAIGLHRPGWIGGDNTCVLRETTIDQLRSEANVADLGANVIRSDRELDGSLGAENSLQLEHSLAGHDDLVHRL